MITMKSKSLSIISILVFFSNLSIKLALAEYASDSSYEQAQQYAPAPYQNYQNYYQQPAQDRQDILALGLPLGLSVVLGLGGLVAGLNSVQQGAMARTSISESLETLQATRTTLATMATSQTTDLTAINARLTPISARAAKLCTTLTALKNVIPVDATVAASDANNLIALKDIGAAFATSTC